MSQFGAPVPKAVTESTAIEIQRKEGSARSWTIASGSLAAGQIVKLTSSGLAGTVGTEDPADIFGIAIFQGVSGGPTTAIRGRVRGWWDGVGTLTPGAELQLSANGSGGWVTGAVSGPSFSIGFYNPFYGAGTAAAASYSGQLVPMELL